jgi:hypothetical protein
MRWAGHVARMGKERGVHRVLVGKPEGKRPLGRPRRRWEDNIKMDFHKVGGGRGDWMELAHDRDQWRTQKFFRGGSTTSVDRGQREQGSGGGSPPVRGSAKFASG